MRNPLYGLKPPALPDGECPADVCPFEIDGAQYPNSCTECVECLMYTMYDPDPNEPGKPQA